MCVSHDRNAGQTRFGISKSDIALSMDKIVTAKLLCLS